MHSEWQLLTSEAFTITKSRQYTSLQHTKKLGIQTNTGMFYYRKIFSHIFVLQFPISFQLISAQLPVNLHVLETTELYDYCANSSISVSIFHILFNAIQKISATYVTVCSSIHHFEAKSVLQMKLFLEMVSYILFLLPSFIYVFPLRKELHTHCSVWSQYIKMYKTLPLINQPQKICWLIIKGLIVNIWKYAILKDNMKFCIKLYLYSDNYKNTPSMNHSSSF